jgi:TolB-like protein
LQQQPDNRRIAVLPLANLSQDARDEIFSDGMTEELISALAKIAGLRVIARTSVMRYKDTKKPIGEISKELNVSAILEGSVRRAGNKIRITVQLADPKTEEQLWTEKYDRDLEDIFAVQSEIAQKVADELEIQINKSEKLNLDKKATYSKEAYTLYLEGRHFLNTRTEDALKRAIELFESGKGSPIRVSLHGGCRFLRRACPARISTAERGFSKGKDRCRESARNRQQTRRSTHVTGSCKVPV